MNGSYENTLKCVQPGGRFGLPCATCLFWSSLWSSALECDLSTLSPSFCCVNLRFTAFSAPESRLNFNQCACQFGRSWLSNLMLVALEVFEDDIHELVEEVHDYCKTHTRTHRQHQYTLFAFHFKQQGRISLPFLTVVRKCNWMWVSIGTVWQTAVCICMLLCAFMWYFQLGAHSQLHVCKAKGAKCSYCPFQTSDPLL